MVKHVHVTLDDEDFKKLKEYLSSEKLTWKEFLLKALEKLEKCRKQEKSKQSISV